jgi:hypothetical protein
VIATTVDRAVRARVVRVPAGRVLEVPAVRVVMDRRASVQAREGSVQAVRVRAEIAAVVRVPVEIVGGGIVRRVIVDTAVAARMTGAMNSPARRAKAPRRS